MKFNTLCSTLALAAIGAMALSPAPISAKSKKVAPVITENADFATKQVALMVAQMDTFPQIPSPRSTNKEGKTKFTTLDDWTSGFFPGNLWYIYELTGDEKFKQSAIKYTEGMERMKFYRGNHDIGFMIFCSFGNGLRLAPKEYYKDVIITAAKTLSERYRPGAGLIQSWPNYNNWKCPVIIDNMMNLELMFEATQMTGDSSFWKIATSHADMTMKHHYRNDISCYHVVDYDPETGAVLKRMTNQGYSDESAWSRGQAWGLYGYTLCYRYTRDPRYLEQAEKIAKFIFENPELPSDLIPYWDYNAPDKSTAPRDASAGAITASALYELSMYTKNGKKYKKLADQMVETLGSPAYRANLGENGNFILMHSTGSLPHKSEIDTPLVYADYYFLEALKRKRDLESK